MKERLIFLIGSVIVLLGSSGCHSRPNPEALFAEAESLGRKYEKAASQEAIANYREAMTGWQRKGDLKSAARASQAIGATYRQLGSLHESLRGYEAALLLARESRDAVLESEIRSDVGMATTLVAGKEEAFDEARAHCQLALESARQSRNERNVGKALTCLGEVAYYRLETERALGFYGEAGRLWDRLGDQRGLAQALVLQGDVHSDLSRFDQAVACYERARLLWISLDDKRGQAITLVAEARLRSRRGEYQEALNGFEHALALLEPMGDTLWEGSSLTGIARVYQDMARTDSALEYSERALRLFETAGLGNVSVDVLNSLGEMYLATGDDAKALNRFERALAVADQQGTRYWKAKALRFIGVVHLFRGLPAQARRYFERSLELQASPGGSRNPRLEARTLADMGEACDLLGEHEAGMKHFHDALALSTSSGDRVGEARGLFGLARASIGLARLDAARTYVERSLTVAESLRSEVESRDLRASYFASVYRYNEFHMDVLMRLHARRPTKGLAAAAFEASERARARSLLDSLAEAGVDLRSGLDQDLLRREQMSRKAFEDWAERRRRLGDTPLPEARAKHFASEYRDLEDRYDQVQAEIRRTSPRYATLVRSRPLALHEVQMQVVDAGTLLLEYALGEERSYLWAVSSHDYTSYELPPRAVIERSAQRVYDRLTARLAMSGDQGDRRDRLEEADLDYWQEAARLSEILLGPVAQIMTGKRLLVVADGALQYVPFAALPKPGRRDEPIPLLVEHEVVSVPSASVLALLRRDTAGGTRPPKAVAVLADPVFESDDPRLRGRLRTEGRGGDAPPRRAMLGFPRLASTRQEAEAIVAAAPAGVVSRKVDFDASRATAMSADLAQYRIVHFATHGVFDDANPGLSGVVLSMFDEQGRAQDGFLRLHDIYGLHLPADLVVLSACNTALGRQVRGEGLVGIVRGFMYAGAKRVVASLWKVEDEATGEMMGRFYVEMLRQHRSPAAALRQAQLAMWQQDRWRPPYYWAAFVLQGEWQ